MRTVRHRFRAGDSQRRLRIVLALCAVVFLLVLGRVALLQTVQADELSEAGRAQRTTEAVLRAQRGTIFDRNGDELALSVPTSTLIANPKLVLDPAGSVSVLASLVGLSAEKQQSLLEAFTAKEKSFVYIARQVDDVVADSVLALGLPGIDAIREDERIMPSGSVGRSVIGRTDPDGIGTAGLEMQYDELLTGQDGERVRERDRNGRSLPGTGTTATEPIPGDDLVLTIDRSMQFQVEQALVARVEALAARGATAIVMDTDTGEIYAAANVRRDDEGVVRVTSANLAAVEAYEPGSVAKVFSVAAAIDQGAVTPESVLSVPGKMVFDEGTPYEFTITDAYPHDTVPMSVRSILVDSSNIGTLLAADRVGATQLGRYLGGFGFGVTTGLGFPGESAGIIEPAEDWQGTERVTVSYGYGFAATSLQLVTAVNTVANDGLYVAPKLVKSTIDAEGAVVDTAPSATHQVLSQESARTMTSMLRDVVCDGTGTRAKVPGVSVAGKTGTGYKVQANGTYQGDDGERTYFATFVGYLPADDPQVTILVSIDEPDPSTQDRFGGTAAAPVFSKLAQAAIHELHLDMVAGDTGCPKT